jgi:hypothetical protein
MYFTLRSGGFRGFPQLPELRRNLKSVRRPSSVVVQRALKKINHEEKEKGKKYSAAFIRVAASVLFL